MKSEKMEKFEQLAEKRMNDVIKKMSLIANLSNKNNYDYTEEHVKQIIGTLKSQLNDLEEKFAANSKEKTSTFKFKK